MRAPTYLRKNRAGTYYFRIAIPKKFQALSEDIPQEVRLSLRTNLVTTASARARRIWTIFQKSFDEMSEFTKEDGVEFVRKCFAEGKAKAKLEAAEKKERNRNDELKAIQRLNPNATLDEDGNIVFGKETAIVQEELKLSDLIDKYLTEQDRLSGWQDKTRSETLSKLTLFSRIARDLPLSKLTYRERRSAAGLALTSQGTRSFIRFGILWFRIYKTMGLKLYPVR